jgi:hypothetical protein
MTYAEFVREIAQPLSGGANDHDGLLKRVDLRYTVYSYSYS